MTDSKPSGSKKVNIATPEKAYDLAGLIVSAKNIEGDKDWDLGTVAERGIQLLYETLSPESRAFIESTRARREAQPTPT